MDHDITGQIDEATGEKLARYVAGRCTPAEMAEIRAWIAAVPGRIELVESLRQAWELARRSRSAWDVDAAWNELRERREAHRARPQPAPEWLEPAAAYEMPRPITKTARWPVPARALRAAAVLVLALGGAAVWSTLPRQGTEAPRAVAMREYATTRGQRAELRLPDGTRVVLNVDSRLRVPEDYGRRSRAVHLEGEALFEVEHDERRPFRVHAEGLIAEDLGTVFGVRSYPGATAATVVVAEGLVEVEATTAVAQSAAPHRLDPGHLAVVTAEGEVRVERAVDAAEYLAFADGRLVFKDTPLRDVAAQLGRWYDLDVRLADSALVARPLTASFQHEPVSRVLNLIALSLDLRYEREGNVVTLYR